MKLNLFSKISFAVSAFFLSTTSFSFANFREKENSDYLNTQLNFDDYYVNNILDKEENNILDKEENNDLLQFQQEKCDILAFSGGGSFGAVEIGILDSLVSNDKIPNNYDIITGISAGGLNAGFLSFYNNISQALPSLYNIYSNLQNSDIYKLSLLKIVSEYSIYNTEPLYNTLHSIISNKIPQKNSPITLIGSSNILNHSLDIFRFDKLNLQDKLDVLMATSAIPLVFPPRIINNTYYVDGGVISNEMIFEAIGDINCDYYNFVFISASNHEPNNNQINGFFSYLSNVIHLIYDTFDYQLSELYSETCEIPKGNIHACFPNSTKLESYSILNFDYGKDLYNLGKNNYYCVDIPFC